MDASVSSWNISRGKEPPTTYVAQISRPLPQDINVNKILLVNPLKLMK